jgi:flavin reductase (DIM6/NTAB) family NADH-FMN oxidoreductase RutF
VPVARELFRAISASFPTGVIIVSSRDVDGTPRGLTTQAYLGLSTVPPLMLVAIDKTARTLAALERSRAFVVNFLRAGSEDTASVFASKSEDKFRGLAWRPCPQAKDAPILHEASVAYAGCLVTEVIDAGDHRILIGSVEAGELFGGAPLMYYRRTYAAWPEERPAPPVGEL